jgi:hypothetical protein
MSCYGKHGRSRSEVQAGSAKTHSHVRRASPSEYRALGLLLKGVSQWAFICIGTIASAIRSLSKL